MSRLTIHKVHIADGFRDDCEELIYRCLQVDFLNYRVFAEIWKDMNFALAFQGRPSGAETAELSEELIHIAKHYMTANPSNFEESVVGMFLVYALVSLQPFPGFALLRLVPEDAAAVLTLEAGARRARRLDVLYVLGALLRTHCEFHAAFRERGMEFAYRKYLTESSTLCSRGIRPKGVFYRHNEELGVIRELNVLSKKYTQAKEQVQDGHDTALSYVDEKFANDLETSIKMIMNGIILPSTKEAVDSLNRQTSVQSVKDRAVRRLVNPMRHLTGITERSVQQKSPIEVKTSPSPKKPPVKKQTNPRPQRSPIIKRTSSKPQKSQKKPTRSSPRKRKTEVNSTQKHSKGKRRKMDDSSSESEVNLDLLSDESDEVDDDSTEEDRTVTNLAKVKLKYTDLPVIFPSTEQMKSGKNSDSNIVVNESDEETSAVNCQIEIVDKLDDDDSASASDIVVDSDDVNVFSVVNREKFSKVTKKNLREADNIDLMNMSFRTKGIKREQFKTKMNRAYRKMNMLQTGTKPK